MTLHFYKSLKIVTTNVPNSIVSITIKYIVVEYLKLMFIKSLQYIFFNDLPEFRRCKFQYNYIQYIVVPMLVKFIVD